MNLKQAEAIASLYQELISSIDKSKIPLAKYYRGNFTIECIDAIELEDGQVKVSWSRYAGCGDYDRTETYHSLDELFVD